MLPAPERQRHGMPDLTLPEAHTLSPPPGSPREAHTPLVQASPAKQAFPFVLPTKDLSHPPVAPRRWPSVLLHRTTASTSRQGTHSTSRAPDRYIPNHNFRTRARENYLLTTPVHRLCRAERRDRKQSASLDPFGSSSRVEARASGSCAPTQHNQYAVPGPSRVPVDADGDLSPRVASQGAVWNVGGSSAAVDGVLSTSDGHGGRLASGTNAPLYKSAFLNQSEPSDGQEMHERRLAAALEVDQANRILIEPVDAGDSPNSPISTSSVGRPASGANSPTVWKDGQ